ncbi:MAG: HlyD family efflux transporter periplasmic adaptor subunit, partial [Rudaea sp.]|nr:HlyD family efflux transporter periplasmic adaptor subunit [Rudaea sp.]
RAKQPALKQRAARVLEAAVAGAATGQSADDAKQALSELSAEIAVSDANIETAKQKVRQAEYEIDARTLRAPMAGRIIVRSTHIGDVVSPSSGELVELLPDATRIVRAELNEGFVNKVSVGMNAEISSETDPGKPQTAKVVRIGEVFGPSKLNESNQEATDTRDVECILELPNNDLKVGQRVLVRFWPTGKGRAAADCGSPARAHKKTGACAAKMVSPRTRPICFAQWARRIAPPQSPQCASAPACTSWARRRTATETIG